MTNTELINLPALAAELQRELAEVRSSDELRRLRNRYLGRGSALANAQAHLGDLPPEERPERGRELMRVRTELSQRLDEALTACEERELEERLARERVDLTMPGLAHDRGAVHPLTQVVRRCSELLRQFGFMHVDGPEVESAYRNFEALNMDEHHPARDLQDTFWLDRGMLLRSHNTTVQVAVLEGSPQPPVKVMSAGRVYRNEDTDATHLAMFHQFEGVWLEAGLTLADLKGVLLVVARAIYGDDSVFRFKPKYYPYTEPSLGVDIRCTGCGGHGCTSCHEAGWVTIAGAGMIHPRVLARFGYDPERMSGLAFGLGISRMVAQAFGLAVMKPLYEQDLRVHESLRRGGW